MDVTMSPRATATLGVLTLAFTAMPAAAADRAASVAKQLGAPRCRAPAGAKILARGPRLVMWRATRSSLTNRLLQTAPNHRGHPSARAFRAVGS